VDNNLNNSSVLNTANTASDDSTNTSLGGVQPSTLDTTTLQGDSVASSSPVDSYYQPPQSFETPDSNAGSVPADQATPDPTQPVEQAPAVEEVVPVSTEPAPSIPDTVEPVVQESVSIPAIDTQPVEQTPAVEEVAPVSTEPAPSIPDTVEPVVQESVSVPAIDTQSVGVESTPVVPETQSQLPVSEDTPQPTESVPAVETPSVPVDVLPTAQAIPPAQEQPAFPANLSQPVESPATSTEIAEEMNTLREGKSEGKESNVVIIVLVLIIVLLLAGIGYFGYQIFLA
jgi:hypothetical protein